MGEVRSRMDAGSRTIARELTGSGPGQGTRSKAAAPSLVSKNPKKEKGKVVLFFFFFAVTYVTSYFFPNYQHSISHKCPHDSL